MSTQEKAFASLKEIEFDSERTVERSVFRYQNEDYLDVYSEIHGPVRFLEHFRDVYSLIGDAIRTSSPRISIETSGIDYNTANPNEDDNYQNC